MDRLSEQVTASKTVFNGRLIDLHVDTVKLPNGAEAQREIVQHPGAVAMIPLLDDGRVVMVRQFRLAANKITLEIPAGTLHGGEDPAEAAARELQEEIGFKPGKLVRLGGHYTAPGYTTEYIHLYLATELESSRLDLDEDEFLEIEMIPLDEALRRVDNGEFEDGKTMIGLMMAARRQANGA
ncbi:MAG TPA: NUDIX hydrolase [Aggregatilinea sp.]|uniref:NUDIX hydrolase n=1 Tax=Aggregatilinea sp. TaxID=2806333 RepID=UPI002C92460F|nr:NUDIX hydrolase [Aggregatilinea sp.]HML22634.1 NUDIX hydrolase [Aggregatilinea sp.]